MTELPGRVRNKNVVREEVFRLKDCGNRVRSAVSALIVKDKAHCELFSCRKKVQLLQFIAKFDFVKFFSELSQVVETMPVV